MRALNCEWVEMGHFLALPDVVAVAADRLVAIVRVDPDGSVVVRDLANGTLSATSASELSALKTELVPPSNTLAAIANSTDAQWDHARRREAALVGLTDSSVLGEQISTAAARLGVSQRTVFRWLARYRANPQTSSLLPQARGTYRRASNPRRL